MTEHIDSCFNRTTFDSGHEGCQCPCHALLPTGWVRRKGWHFYVMGSRYPVCQRAVKRRLIHEFRDWVPSTEPDRCRECRRIKSTLTAEPMTPPTP